jgi:thioesterase domain-containing protein/acyl carrier protein
VREELEALLGVPVLETYGTSEAGMITSPDPFGPRKDGTVGAAAGVEVAVHDESGAALPPNASGEIVVRGPTVFSGYEGDAELSQRSLRDGWLRTGDLGSLDEDGFLSLEGRVDDVINRGGEKVSPQEVEELLRAHPDVAEAVVFGVPHPTLGQEVGAAVTLLPDHGVAEDALRAYLGDRVATFKVPRRLVVLSELPAGPTGKPLRAGMAERLGLNLKPADGEGTEPPSGPMETILARAWGEVLERGDIGPDDDFFEQGGDSLAAVELFAVIDEEIRVELSLEDLVEAPTPRLLARRMLRGAYLDGYEPAAGRDIVAVNASGSKPPLFAVGGRPGHALRVLLVGRALGPDQPVYGLQPPGMDWHASGLQRLTQMAAHHVSNVRKAQPQGPYRLLGSSFGGLVVFEMALQLERAGEEVEFLGLVDSEPPGLSWMPEADPLPHALEDLDAPSGPSIDRGGSIVTSGSRVSLAHIDARRTYVTTDRLRCPLTLFLCAAEGVPPGGDRRRLWAETTTGGLRLVELPGLHAAFDREPQFSALRDALRSLLAGEPPLELDPKLVFDRTYTLESGSEGEVIRGNDGSSFRVEQGAMRGRARAVKARRGKLLVRGWASDPERRRSGETVVAFLGGRYAGYSTCGAPTERLERRHSAPGLRYAGFRLRLDLPTDGPLSEEPRLFALDQHDRASELRVTA